MIKEFELMHGAVLTKIVRKKTAISLCLIEKNIDDAWPAYKINEAVFIYIKHRAKSRKAKRRKGLAWTFSFSPEEMKRVLQSSSLKKVFAALVCGDKSVKSKNMVVCFLELIELRRCINLASEKSQNVTVLRQRGKGGRGKALRVYGPLNNAEDSELKISNNCLEDWEIPGS